jgi:hypothetical protein
MNVKTPGFVFNTAVFVAPAALIVAALVHRSWPIGISGALIALAMGVAVLVARQLGEAGKLVTGEADDERHRQFQLRAWANTGQVLMILLVAGWVAGPLLDGEAGMQRSIVPLILLGIGGLTGGVTVLWLRSRR